MEIQPQNTQPISDDQELAKVLAGVNKQVETELADPMAIADANVNAPVAAGSVADLELTSPVASPEAPVAEAEPALPATPEIAPVVTLDGVKIEAINELKPLMDKINLPAEEKFDLYLLIIRSTDDKTLIAPAHDTAKMIADDTRRANALVDIIKEIDYLTAADKKDLALAA